MAQESTNVEAKAIKKYFDSKNEIQVCPEFSFPGITICSLVEVIDLGEDSAFFILN